MLSEPGGTISDSSFLMEMMELRETIESSQSPAELEGIAESTREAIQSTLQDLARFHEDKDMDALAHEAIRLQYLTKAEAEITSAIESLGSRADLS